MGRRHEKQSGGFNWRAFWYISALVVGVGLAVTPFAMGGFTLAGAAAVVADFVALPVANAIFGWLLSSAAGTWGTLAVGAALPLAVTAIVDAVQATVSAITRPKTTFDDERATRSQARGRNNDDYGHDDNDNGLRHRVRRVKNDRPEGRRERDYDSQEEHGHGHEDDAGHSRSPQR